MAELLPGKPVSDHIMLRIRQQVGMLSRRPTLVAVRVGAREDDKAYERALQRKCEDAGIGFRVVMQDEDASEHQIIQAIHEQNEDDSVDGILLFQPLPKEPPKDMARIRNAICAEKDVDVISDASLAHFFLHTGTSPAPCTAEACLELLRCYDVPLTGAEAVVIGRSFVIGRPLAALLLQQNATVTVCHTKTRDLPAVCRRADILIAAAGVPKLIGADHVREGQIVVDVGVHVLPSGEMCGDVDADAVRSVVRALTPVPRGVGAVTTAVLLEHVCKAAMKREGMGK